MFVVGFSRSCQIYEMSSPAHSGKPGHPGSLFKRLKITSRTKYVFGKGSVNSLSGSKLVSHPTELVLKLAPGHAE